MNFKLDTKSKRINIDKKVVGNVFAEVPGIAGGLGFVLFIRDGQIKTLECFSYLDDFKWPIKEFKLKIVES